MSAEIITADSLGPNDSPELAGATILSGEEIEQLFENAEDRDIKAQAVEPKRSAA